MYDDATFRKKAAELAKDLQEAQADEREADRIAIDAGQNTANVEKALIDHIKDHAIKTD